MSIDKKINEIESILTQLESDDVDLDKASDYYSDALKKAESVIKDLDTIDEKIIRLTETTHVLENT